jgi:type VI secretion system VasI family protein
MKIIVALISTFALSQAAFAQTPDCRSQPDPGVRLACYDKAAALPAAAAQQPATQKAQKPQAAARNTSKADSGQYVDSISAEDARMNSRLKTICRGC